MSKTSDIKVRFKNGEWVKIFGVRGKDVLIKNGLLFVKTKKKNFILNWDNALGIEETEK